ncbi:hypothetical protein KPH14_003425 [Odynerus spinipes]|uniref:Uncharacterized protein n=1 Tax=Odynerus spinipes TaxID=1348599 RepID=A0AAD9VJR0_9HYME|nr:hypothetical protein KPH14_003425 [Odynerus spinipes]
MVVVVERGRRVVGTGGKGTLLRSSLVDAESGGNISQANPRCLGVPSCKPSSWSTTVREAEDEGRGLKGRSTDGRESAEGFKSICLQAERNSKSQGESGW